MLTKLFNEGYVCGALIGCGKVVCEEDKGRYSIFAETSSMDMANHYFERLKVLLEKEPKMYSRSKNGLNLWSVVYYGKEDVQNFYDKYTFKQGCFEWMPPKMVYEDKHFRRGFLQGYFDAKAKLRVRYRKRKDGAKFRFEKVIGLRVNSVNHKGISEVMALLSSLGVGSNISKSGKSFILDVEGKLRVNSFMEKVGFGLPSKQEEVQKALSNNNSGNT